MNIMIETNILHTSQQGYDIEFTLLNECDVPCIECLPRGEHIYLVVGM